MMMTIMLQSVAVCTFHTLLGWPKKDPDQIATNPQEELGKEEQRPKLKTAEERTATTSRAM
jgi:hypothetical protein